jgi:hypothetical protein
VAFFVCGRWDWYGLVWARKRKTFFFANKFSKWLLHVAEGHMSNTPENKSIIQTHKALSAHSNREVMVA